MKRALVASLIAALLASPAVSQGQGDDLARAQARHQDETLRARRLRSDANAVALEVERLRVELRRLGQEESGDLTQVSAQRARLADINDREIVLRVRLGRERGRQTRLLAALQLYGRNPPPALLVSPERANDAIRAQILMRSVTPVLEARARRLAADQAALSRLRRQAVIAAGDLLTSESSLADRRADIDRLIAEKRALETLLLADAATAEAEALAAGRRVRDLGGLLRELTPAEREAVRATPLPGGRERLLRPVDGPLVSEFGGGAHGLTFSGSDQGLVRAPADGVVEYAGPLEGWSEVVVLRLGPGWRLVLAGLGRASVQIGARISAGEPLGRLPQGEAPELYFELRRDDRPVDPAPWLDARAGA